MRSTFSKRVRTPGRERAGRTFGKEVKRLPDGHVDAFVPAADGAWSLDLLSATRFAQDRSERLRGQGCTPALGRIPSRLRVSSHSMGTAAASRNLLHRSGDLRTDAIAADERYGLRRRSEEAEDSAIAR
jgi:hypothetical protein